MSVAFRFMLFLSDEGVCATTTDEGVCVTMRLLAVEDEGRPEIGFGEVTMFSVVTHLDEVKLGLAKGIFLAYSFLYVMLEECDCEQGCACVADASERYHYRRAACKHRCSRQARYAFASVALA